MGVKLRKIDNTLYMQIKQAKLLPGLEVDFGRNPSNESLWKSVELSNDKIMLKNNLKIFGLTHVDYEKQYPDNMYEYMVVTGIRFSKKEFYICIEVRLTRFDFIRGSLSQGVTRWFNCPEVPAGVR